MGDGADAVDEDAAEIADESVGEVLEGGEDFVLEVINTEALAESVDTFPATEGVFEGGGELADEADGLVDDDWGDDGDNDAEDEDDDDVGHDGGEGGVFFFGQALDAGGERLNRNRKEEGDADDDEAGEGFPDEERDEAESENNEPETDEGFCININAVAFLIHEAIIA